MYMLLIEGEIKPGSKEDFLNIWGSQILPSLKKQSGFVDEILLFEGSNKPTGLCFWRTREDGENYQRNVFPNVVSHVGHLVVGRPTIRNFEVAAAETFKITAKKAA